MRRPWNLHIPEQSPVAWRSAIMRKGEHPLHMSIPLSFSEDQLLHEHFAHLGSAFTHHFDQVEAFGFAEEIEVEVLPFTPIHTLLLHHAAFAVQYLHAGFTCDTGQLDLERTVAGVGRNLQQ